MATTSLALAFSGCLKDTETESQKAPRVYLSATSLAENVGAGATIGTLSTLHPDAGGPFIYELVPGNGSTDNTSFGISEDQLRIVGSADFETKSSYSVRVRSIDIGAMSTGGMGLAFERAFTISITNVNESPSALSLSSSSIAENNAVGATVGTLSSTDPDSSDTFTYSLVSGAGADNNASFSVAGNELKLQIRADFETKSSYSVRVRSTDSGGLSFERAFTISITNVNESPSALSLSSSSIAENNAVGATVGTLSSTDPDSSDTFTYSLVSGAGDTDNSSFNLFVNQLTLGVSTNFEAKSSYSVRVRSTDSGGLSFEQAFTISITDVSDQASMAEATSSDGSTVRLYESSSMASKNVAFSVACGDSEKLLAGGCSCANGDGITSSLRASGEGWSCSCDDAPSSGVHKVFALCTNKAGVTRTEATRVASANQSAAQCSDPSLMARVGVGVQCVNPSAVPQKIQSAYPTFGDVAIGYGDCTDSTLERTTSVQCLQGLPSTQWVRVNASTASGTTTAVASCRSGQVAIGGGCACDSGAMLLETRPSPDLRSHSCTCSDGTLNHSMSAMALCTSSDANGGDSIATESTSTEGFPIRRYESMSKAGKNTPFSVSCGGGETLLAGGCSCANGDGITSSLRTSGEGWSCSCDDPPSSGFHKAVALCTNKSGVTRTEASVTETPVSSGQAGCGAPPVLRLGSGVLCGPSVAEAKKINKIGESSAASARGDCQDVTNAITVTAQCITGGPTVKNAAGDWGYVYESKDTEMTGSSFVSTQSCPAGKLLVGGTCDCPTGEYLYEYYPSSDFSTLQCKCSNNRTVLDAATYIRSRVLCAD